MLSNLTNIKIFITIELVKLKQILIGPSFGIIFIPTFNNLSGIEFFVKLFMYINLLLGAIHEITNQNIKN